MSDVTITIKLEVSPALEKLIEVLATAQCYQYDEDFDDDGIDEDDDGA